MSLVRRTPLRSKIPLRQVTPLRAKNPSPRRPAKRIGKEKVFAPFVRWIHDRACVVCGRAGDFVQGSHVGPSLGMGRPHGYAYDQVPMCGPRFDAGAAGCHADWEQSRGVFRTWSRERRRSHACRWRLEEWLAFVAWAAGRREIRAISACDDAIRAILPASDDLWGRQ